MTDDLNDCILRHLSDHEEGSSERAPLVGLLASVMEGLQRGWVESAMLTRVDGLTHLHYILTERGDRAVDTYLRRMKAL